ncbi:ATPase, T2SS/T4P/T4SS family [Priestia sp. BR_2]
MNWSALMNLLLILIILVSVLIFFIYKLNKLRNQAPAKKLEFDSEKFRLDKIHDFVADSINEYLSINLLDLGLSTEEYRRREANMGELQNALRNANTGDIQEKIYVKQHIRDLLTLKYEINKDNIDYVIPFRDLDRLSSQDKFEILMVLYKKQHGFKALDVLIQQYDLARPKRIIEGGTTESYVITEAEIDEIYAKEAHGRISFDDKLAVVVQRIYQEYKGHGVIDEIRDMSIDGVSGGVSGLPPSMQLIDDELELLDQMHKSKKGTYNSIWIFYRGNPIHLSFLSFETEHDLKRVAQNIYKYDSKTQLTEDKPYVVNDMKDGSRVVVVRPPFAESWAFWVRKFDLPNMTLEKLISDESAENAELPREMIKFLMKGGRVTGFTGDQGAGKTSVAMASVKYIDAKYTLRIQEMAFELHLRRLYPERNTIAFRETDSISGQESLDVTKKTDGTVSILGEISTDEVASWFVKMATVASKFTIFTAHPKSFNDLIDYLRNALVNKKFFTDQKAAEDQVARVLEMDVHLEKNNTGKRYIERITESIYTKPEDNVQFVTEIEKLSKQEGMEAKMEALIAIQLEAHRKNTMKNWSAHNIIEYRDGKYIAMEPLSHQKVKSMLSVMSPEDGLSFKAFLKKYWGHVSYD